MNPRESVNFTVKVNVDKVFPQIKLKIGEYIYIRSTHFDIKLPVTIYLTNDLQLTTSIDAQLSKLNTDFASTIIEESFKTQSKEISLKDIKAPEIFIGGSEDIPQMTTKESYSNLEPYLRNPNLERAIELALKQERERHSQQSEKALTLLKLKDKEIEDLSKIKERLLNEQAKLQDQYNENINKEETLKQTINELNVKIEQYENEERKELEMKVREMERVVEDYKKREDMVLELADQQEKIKNSYIDQINKKNEEIIGLTGDLDSANKLVRQHQNEVKDDSMLLTKLRKENESLLGKIKELSERHRINLAEIVDLNTDADEVDYINKIKQKIKDLENEIIKFKVKEEKAIISKNELIKKHEEELTTLKEEYLSTQRILEKQIKDYISKLEDRTHNKELEIRTNISAVTVPLVQKQVNYDNKALTNRMLSVRNEIQKNLTREWIDKEEILKQLGTVNTLLGDIEGLFSERKATNDSKDNKDLKSELNELKEEATYLDRSKFKHKKLKLSSSSHNEQNKKLQRELEEKQQIIKSQENQIQALQEKYTILQNTLSKEIPKYGTNTTEELKEHYDEAKKASKELISIQELQLKLMREKFKEEYIELNKIITASNKGTKNVVEVKERTVDLMFQLSQKEAEVKVLHKSLSKLRTKMKRMNKEKTIAKENNGLIVNRSDDYNTLLKSKIALELKVEAANNKVKKYERELSFQKELTESALTKLEEAKKELQSTKSALSTSKKEQANIIKSHRNEFQSLIDGLTQADWKEKTQKSGKESRSSLLIKYMNNQTVPLDTTEKFINEEEKVFIKKIKELKEAINRKDEIIKTYKEKLNKREKNKKELKDKLDEIERLKTKILNVKQETERKDKHIDVLTARVNTLMNKENTLKESCSLTVIKK